MPVHDADTSEKVKIESVTPYGCSNKSRGEFYIGQNGWRVGGTRIDTKVVDDMSQLCRYDKRPTDPRCGECKLPSDEDYLRSYGL